MSRRFCVFTPWKHPHATRAEAQRAADEMNARHRGRQRTSVYRCRCGCGYLPTHKGAITRRQRAERRRAHL